ncbi:hypothetical protein DHEL01_v211216 [Diaporthe helianthi]|uniref:Uncharacterized protein n=1 Tax=Diaporthe helianthi TaxID=158607 RepID=A0A2P5HJG7_DIAHE|nr:hypothetical protein DHEL01_v211216 [Diaporthe helianthi]
MVFAFIYTIIFESKPYFLGVRWKELDMKIGMMENTLQESTTPEMQRDLIEWRVASFTLTEKFRDNGESLSCAAQHEVWEFFGVVQPKSLEAEQQGMESLKVICDDAVELSLTIRRLKDDVEIDKLAGAVYQPISEWADRAEEVVSVPASKNTRPGTIAYVIAGALVKSTKEDPTKDLVLEKAEVAIFE